MCGHYKSIIKTVNVISFSVFSGTKLLSFSDDTNGNLEAKREFDRIITELDPRLTDKEIDNYLHEGYFSFGNWEIYLIHSV